MSWDMATLKLCPHTIGPERVVLEREGRMSFAFARTPSNSNVTVNIDGVNVPPSGLYSPASVVFRNPEPYRIVSGQSDMLSVQVIGSASRTVQFPSGSSVRASDVAKILGNAVPELTFEVKNKRVVARTPGPFKGSFFMFPDPRWYDRTKSVPSTSRILGAMSQFGISPGRVGTGVKLFPSWIIKTNPNAFYEQYIAEFDSPIPNRVSCVTVTYQTVAQLCSRCFGSRLEYDYTVSGQSYETVENTDLLAQELDKFLFTRIGSHWKWRWLGSSLLDRVGGKADTASGLASGFVSMDVNRAFSTYQNIKQQQDRSFPQQDVTDAEFPNSIVALNSYTDPSDPTTVYVKTVVSNRSRTSVPITRVVSTPDPFQVMSDPSGILKNAGSGFRFRG